MFQFTWFDKKKYWAHSVQEYIGALPQDFTKVEDVESFRTLYWDEHCLECSPPYCYENCNHWQKRKDNSCVRLYYGIKRNKKIKDALWGAELKFRAWGKLESRINKGGVSLKELKELQSWDEKYTNFNKCLSKLSNVIFKNYKFSSRAEGIKRRKYAQIKESGAVEDMFFFQCFSKLEKEYNLCLEITDRENIVLYRKTLLIKHGFNEYIIKLDCPLIEGGLIRLYPENDYDAELIIYVCDLVKMKKSQEKAIPQLPAKKVKCVAWDLDCTVWDGILIESDPNRLRLREGVLELIKQLDERGIIQIVVSKNTEDEVLPQLKRLSIDNYFVYKFINWQPKSGNIIEAAKILNINVDTFALIDDSVFERNEVSAVLPCVRVYDENVLSTLLNNEEFDIVITEESKRRREMYQTEAIRKNISTQYAGDNISFLRSCELKLKIRQPQTEEEYNRSFDLIHRTNQLNLSGEKYEKIEFETILRDEGRENFIVDCFDKYGNYGQVAFISIRNKDEALIDEYAMSCRVANKYVESAVVLWLQNHFKKDIIMRGNVTQRNKLLVETFEKIGFENFSTEKKIELKLRIDKECIHNDIVEVLKGD